MPIGYLGKRTKGRFESLRRGCITKQLIYGCALGALMLWVLVPRTALAVPLGCTDIGGTDAAGTCTLSTVYNCTGGTVIQIPDNLLITNNGGVNCNGAAGKPAQAGNSLAIAVAGDFTLAGSITSHGGVGGAGGFIAGVAGQPGAAGAPGGSIQITVGGNMNVDSGDMAAPAQIGSVGGSGGSGGSASISGSGGAGGAGGAGATLTIGVKLAYTQNMAAIIDVSGGAGGPGGSGAKNGNGGNGGAGAAGGSVTIFSCNTFNDGIIGAVGGAGGAGGTGAGTGNGGSNGNGADGGSIIEESGTNVTYGPDSPIRAVLGGTEGAVGARGPRGATGVDNANPGNGGSLVFNSCPQGTVFGLGNLVALTFGGSASGIQPSGDDGTATKLSTAPCCPCAISVAKLVAADTNCDGTADSAFSGSVSVDPTQCVVYQVCVTNTGDVGAGANDVPQPVAGVSVSDAHLGIADTSFGTILPGSANKVCKLIPSALPASQCAGGKCVCQTVEGTNTATVNAATATCSADTTPACEQSASVCNAMAVAACNTPTNTPTNTATNTATATPTPTRTPTVTATFTSVSTPVCSTGVDADIVLILDRTGSMSSSDLADENAAAKALLDFFKAGSPAPRVGIVAFGTSSSNANAVVVQGMTNSLSPAPYGASSPASGLYAAINTATTSASSFTNLQSAMTVAQAELTGPNGASMHKVIILISDGDPNRPTGGCTSGCSADIELAQDGSDASKTAVPPTEIFTIHFGSDPSGFAGPELLAAMATGTVPAPTPGHQPGSDNESTAAHENGDGDHFYIAPTSADLQSIVVAISQTICVTPTPSVVTTTEAKTTSTTTTRATKPKHRWW